MQGSNQPNPGTSMVPVTEGLWTLGLQKWKIIYMPPRLDGIRSWILPSPLERLCRHMVEDSETRGRVESWLHLGVFQGTR